MKLVDLSLWVGGGYGRCSAMGSAKESEQRQEINQWNEWTMEERMEWKQRRVSSSAMNWFMKEINEWRKAGSKLFEWNGAPSSEELRGKSINSFIFCWPAARHQKDELSWMEGLRPVRAAHQTIQFSCSIK